MSNSSSRQAVSTVIPSYNGIDLLKKNLSAVISLLDSPDELVIIDDASQDKTVGWLIKKYDLSMDSDLSTDEYTVYLAPDKFNFPQIKLIQNITNLRFAASCNRAVKLANKKLIFLINNDVVPHENVLQQLAPWFEKDQVFTVGCLEIEHNQGGILGGKNTLWFEKGLFVHSRADNFETGPTAWASGGSAMFDREKWLKLGGFDLAYYPAYWEDVDLSYRAKKRGWQVMFERQAVVDHNHKSTNQTAFGKKEIDWISWNNANKFVWKNGNLWQKLAHIMWKPYWWLKGKE